MGQRAAPQQVSKVTHEIAIQTECCSLGDRIGLDNSRPCPEQLLIDGEIENVACRFLVDTGSSLTIINPTVWNTVKQNCPDKSLQSSEGPRLVSVTGSSLEVLGETDLLLNISGIVDVHRVVIANIKHNILGLDFLSHHNCKINVAGAAITANLSEKSSRLKVEQITTLKPYEEVIFQARVESEHDNFEGLIEGCKKFEQKNNVIVARCVVTSRSGVVPVRVVNVSPNPVTLHRHCSIGSLVPLISDEFKLSQYPEQVNDVSGESLFDACAILSVNNVPGNGEHTSDFQKLESDLNLQGTDAPSEIRDKLSELVHKHAAVFSQSQWDIGRTDKVFHRINTGNQIPIKQHPRRVPIHLREEVDNLIGDMEKQGIIEECQSPWSAPMVLVKKRDGSVRICIDYRALNAKTLKDSFPLPRISDILDLVEGACWFSTLDLTSGYWQVEVDPKDRDKTAFVTTNGLYRFRVMPFGLCNAPSTFQRLMQLVLAGLDKRTAMAYLDDLIIMSSTCEDHLANLDGVLHRLGEAGLKVRPEKCKLMRKEVAFLGHIISGQGIRTDPEKTDAIKTWPTPLSVKEVRAFLGLAGYYRRFVKGFSKLAAPLHKLADKSEGFKWTTECDHAFSELKAKLVSAPILAFPLPEGEFILDTDASDQAVGAVLSQVQGGVERVIAYGSKALSKAEKKYCVTRKELLAVVYFCQHFRYYLLGRHFKLRSDHSSLQWLRNFKEPEGQVARWLEQLAEFDFTLVYREGARHNNADALSRRPCPQCRECHAVLVMPDNSSDAVPSSPCDLRTQQLTDSDIGAVLNWVTIGSRPDQITGHSLAVRTLLDQWELLCIKEGVLYRKRPHASGVGEALQLVVPRVLRPKILTMLHNDSGHLGHKKTWLKVRSRFYWPQARAAVQRWCAQCGDCARRKFSGRGRRAELIPSQVGFPFERVAVDILGPLPMSNRGNKYILVVADYFTRWVEAFALPDQEALTIAKVIVSEWVCRFGTPYYLHSDQGRNFEAKLIADICKLLGIAKTRTSPYHPASDGLVERMNRTILSMLSHRVEANEKTWDEQLPHVMLAYRSSVHEATGYTPYHLLFGREVKLPVDVMFGVPETRSMSASGYDAQLASDLEDAFQEVRVNQGIAQRRMKEVYDRKVHGSPYNVNDFVWLHCPAVPKGRSPKFHRPWQGPYKVLKKISDSLYRIRIGSRRKVVHFNRLKPCECQPVSGDQPSQGSQPVTTDNTERPAPEEPGTPGSAGPSDTDEPEWDIQSMDEAETGLRLMNHLRGREELMQRPARDRHPPERFGVQPW